MAYENVNVYKLDNALNKLDNINADKVKNLISSIQSEQWQSLSRVKIISALNVIISEINAIQKEIKTYKTVASYIEEYKEVENDVDNYDSKLSSYKKKLDRVDEDDSWSKDYYQDKVDSYESKLSSKRSRLNTIKNKINNLMS